MSAERDEIFIRASTRLRAEFEELRSVPHHAVRGGEAEGILREFLGRHLPRRWGVGAGFLMDRLGQLSPQSDVIVYDALNCPTYLPLDSGAIYPADNVAAVVEAKSTLDKEELVDSWNKIWNIRGQAKTPVPPTDQIVTYRTHGFVFGFQARTSLDSLASNYVDLIRTHGIGQHLDGIVVLDQGVITLASKSRQYPKWNPTLLEGFGGPSSEGAHFAVSVVHFGPHTLDYFLRILLGHLILFRHFVDYPGLEFTAPTAPKQQKLIYVTSITHETDPIRAKQNLERYAREVQEEFKPQDSGGAPEA